jgi:hypothetical protein
VATIAIDAGVTLTVTTTPLDLSKNLTIQVGTATADADATLAYSGAGITAASGSDAVTLILDSSGAHAGKYLKFTTSAIDGTNNLSNKNTLVIKDTRTGKIVDPSEKNLFYPPYAYATEDALGAIISNYLTIAGINMPKVKFHDVQFQGAEAGNPSSFDSMIKAGQYSVSNEETTFGSTNIQSLVVTPSTAYTNVYTGSGSDIPGTKYWNLLMQSPFHDVDHYNVAVTANDDVTLSAATTFTNDVLVKLNCSIDATGQTLTKAGSGTFDLTTYAIKGSLTVSAGEVHIGETNDGGSTSVTDTLTLAAGAKLVVNGDTTIGTLVLSSNG